MVPRVFNGFLPMLNRFLRAPLEASQALLASVKPRRLFIDHLDVAGRANLGADSTAITFIIDPEFLVHLPNRSKRHLIDPRKEDVLP